MSPFSDGNIVVQTKTKNKSNKSIFQSEKVDIMTTTMAVLVLC